jgi:MurNAc alpha-1-phosphate uridylyltransferase
MTGTTWLPGAAIVLSAGLGERMRPLTLTTPKPILPVGGKPMLDWSLDRLEDAGIENIVVNTHWLPEQIEAHVAARNAERGSTIRISREVQRLETGGGIVQALPLLGDAPFLAMNSDTICLNGPTPVIQRMVAAWDSERMDALLLVMSAPRTQTEIGYGDMTMDPLGRLEFRVPPRVAPYVCAGMYLYHPRLFEGCSVRPFSVLELWRKAAAAGRLYGIVHDGAWFTVGNPDELAAADPVLQNARWIEFSRG